MVDEKGETRRERNARFGAEAPEADVPEQAMHVWHWFWELSNRRQTGPEAIQHVEIDAWAMLNGRALLPVEVEWLTAMDDMYLKVVREDLDAARRQALEDARNVK
jgi:hypothetical protein